MNGAQILAQDIKLTEADNINDFLKQVREEKKSSREAIKPTRIGSTLPKTAEDELY